jgi:cytochrome c
LFLNGLVGADTTLDAASLAAIEMPNRDGFIWIDVPPESMPP